MPYFTQKVENWCLLRKFKLRKVRLFIAQFLIIALYVLRWGVHSPYRQPPQAFYLMKQVNIASYERLGHSVGLSKQLATFDQHFC